MYEWMEHCLFNENPARFQHLRRYVKEFNAAYNGNNIIQDDIFNIAGNYAEKNGTHLELLRLPIQDEAFCAFTCVRDGELFMVLNSYLPVCKQIFAAAHELYHIWCYISNQDDSLLLNGSFLTAEILDDTAAADEDQEANAFAALLLVSSTALNEQMEIYGLDQNHIELPSIIRLMDIFAVPFKAIVLRLYEEQILDKRTTGQLLNDGTPENLQHIMEQENLALRWQKSAAQTISFGMLPGLILKNQAAGYLPEQRIQEDLQRLKDIYASFSGM